MSYFSLRWFNLIEYYSKFQVSYKKLPILTGSSQFFVSYLGLYIQLLWVNAVEVFGKANNSGCMNVNMSCRFASPQNVMIWNAAMLFGLPATDRVGSNTRHISLVMNCFSLKNFTGMDELLRLERDSAKTFYQLETCTETPLKWRRGPSLVQGRVR